MKTLKSITAFHLTASNLGSIVILGDRYSSDNSPPLLAEESQRCTDNSLVPTQKEVMDGTLNTVKSLSLINISSHF